MLHELRLAVRRLVPVSLHGAAKALVLKPTALLLSGSQVSCPCCGRGFRRFLRYPALFCPSCSSYERHRFLCLYFERHPELLGAVASVLHVAPEPCIQKLVLASGVDDYLSIDLEYRLAMRKMDVTALDLPDDHVDLIVCSHVLVEIPEQERALAEFIRALKPGGLALFQDPVHLQEQPPLLEDELARLGYEVDIAVAGDLGPELVERHGLIAAEKLYLARKPLRSAA